MRRLKQLITFHLERFLLGGIKNQLLFIAFLIVLISIIAGVLIYSLYPGSKFSDSIWWGFLRLSDPGYLGEDKELARKVISTIVTVLGYVIFMGSLVAIMTQWLNGKIKKLESGLTPISLQGHILILGWNHKSSVIIKELLSSEERVTRFLKRKKASQLNIVVLADEVDSSIIQDLKDRLGKLWNGRNIIFRMGSPLQMDHLHRVDFSNASAIIMPGIETTNKSISSDVQVFKVLKTISHYFEHNEIEDPPLFVTEINEIDKIPVMQSLYKGKLELVITDLFLSKLIAQAILHPGLSYVLDEIFSNDGSEIYIRCISEFQGLTFGEIFHAFPKAVPIGIYSNLENGERSAELNPDNSLTIKENDSIILFSKTFLNTSEYKKGKVVKSSCETHDKPYDESYFHKNILIIGWNSKLSEVLIELDTYIDYKITVDVFSSIDKTDREIAFDKEGLHLKHITVRNFIGNSTSVDDLSGLEFKLYNNIVIMAQEHVEVKKSDAKNILTYSIIDYLKIEHGIDPMVCIELLEEDNSLLFDGNKTDVIVSATFRSYFLALITIRNQLSTVFYELISAGGVGIYIKNISYYNLSEQDITFDEILDIVKGYNDIALGIYIHGPKPPEWKKYHLNPPKSKVWNIKPGDKIIVISNKE